MSRAFRLGFIELGTQRLEPELKYYTEVIGAKVTERAADGSVYLSLGLDHHNIALKTSEEAGLRCFGLQVTNDRPLEDWATHLKDRGLTASLKTDARPGVPKLLEMVEPGGHVLQLYSEMSQPAPASARRASCPTSWDISRSSRPTLRNL